MARPQVRGRLARSFDTFVAAKRAPRSLLPASRFLLRSPATHIPRVELEEVHVAARLILLRENQQFVVELQDGSYTIGNEAPADIVIPDPAIASRHAGLTVTGEKVVLTDLGSNRGTAVNGLRVMQFDEREIRPGDRITMGDATFAIGGGDGGPAFLGPQKPILVVNGKVVRELEEGRYVIGRSPHADIQIDDTSVSGRHAELEVSKGKVRLRDLGSTNGTWLDAGQVRESDVEEVTSRNRIQIGDVILNIQYRSAEESAGSPESATAPPADDSSDGGILGFLFGKKK